MALHFFSKQTAWALKFKRQILEEHQQPNLKAFVNDQVLKKIFRKFAHFLDEKSLETGERLKAALSVVDSVEKRLIDKLGELRNAAF